MDTNNKGKNVENVEEKHTAHAGLSQLVNDVIAAINATKVGAKLGVMAFPPIEKTLSDMIADGVAGTDVRGMLQWYRENHTKPYVPGFKYPAGFGEWYDSIIAARRRIEAENQPAKPEVPHEQREYKLTRPGDKWQVNLKGKGLVNASDM